MSGLRLGLTLGRSSRLAALTYVNKVLSYDPVAVWPLGESSGTVADNAEGTALLDGTYVGAPTLAGGSFKNGDAVPTFDGTDDYVDVETVTLGTLLTPAEMSAIVWGKVPAAGDWTARHVLFRMDYSLGDFLFLEIDGLAAGEFRWLRRAGAVTSSVTSTVFGSTLDWFVAGMTVSEAADEMKAYAGGAQAGTTQTGLGAWSGTMSLALLGAQSPTLNLWHGNLAYAALFNGALSGADMADLAVVG